MSALELKQYQQKLRRRATCRRNQRRYRDRLKQRETAESYQVALVKRRLDVLRSYKTLISHGRFLKPARCVELRSLILRLYAQYFEYGVDVQDRKTYTTQLEFLKFNLAPDCVVGKIGLPTGPGMVLEQWEKLTLSHAKIQTRFVSMRCLDPAQSFYRLTLLVQATITHATIAVIYPHMLLDHAFLSQAVGQQIQYHMSFNVLFLSDNKIVFLSMEHSLTEGWCRVLNYDMRLVAEVSCEKRLDDETTFITTDCDSILQIVRDYST